MLKELWLIPIILALAYASSAQQKTSLTASSTGCATANSCLIYGVDSTSGAVTITISTSSTGSWTAQFEKSGDARSISDTTATWVAASSTDATPISSATGSGSWQFNVAAYTAVRVRLSAYSSGAAIVSIIPSTASARSNGGGGGGGSGTVNSGTATDIAYYATTGTAVSGDTNLTDTGSALTYSGGPIVLPSNGVNPSDIYFVGNTSLPALSSNQFALFGPAVATFTSFSFQVPSAIPTTNHLLSCVVTSTNCIISDSGVTAISNTTTTVSSATFNAGTCSASATTVTMTGVSTASTFAFTPSADASSLTGWGTTGGLVVDAWPTSNTLNYKICNQTAGNITSSTITFNVSAR